MIKNLVDILLESKNKNKPEIKTFIDTTFKEIQTFQDKDEEFKNQQIKLYQKRIINFVDLLLKNELPPASAFAPIDVNNISKQINNPYYKGAEYDVKTDKDFVKITNINTKESIDIDLNKLVEKLPFSRQLEMKQIIAKLPAEVLVDMYHEADIVEDESFFAENKFAAGRYSSSSFLDNIALNKRFYIKDNLIHELGHAIDNVRTEKPSFSFRKNIDYKEVFEKELEEYIAKGKKQFQYNTIYDETDDFIYCTASIEEMFAECYTLLMLGDCKSKNSILNHFPKTLENVKKHLEYIRSLPQEVRHKK